MISKEMYDVLKQIPRHPQMIPYSEIKHSNSDELFNILCEAAYHAYDYINTNGSLLKESELSLTEKGQATIEEYAQDEKNQKMISKSLNVARIAMWAAIASAITAVFSLIKILI